MTNRGWIVLNILFIAYVFLKLEWIDTKLNTMNNSKEINSIAYDLDRIKKEVDSNASVHGWNSIAYKISKIEKEGKEIESNLKKIESNLKQVVESCGKHWKYY